MPRRLTPAKIVLLLSTFLTFVALSIVFYSLNQREPEVLVGKKDFGVINTMNISGESGGTFVSKDGKVKVLFPEGFANGELTILYRSVNDAKRFANNRVGPMYQLAAVNSKGEDVLIFNKPVTIESTFGQGELKKISADAAGTYSFDVAENSWIRLESSVMTEEDKIVATADHFTTFASATDNPNAASGLNSILRASLSIAAHAQTSGEIVIDDTDPEPLFVARGTGFNGQPSYWGSVPWGYNGSASFTGNSKDGLRRNWATWNATGVEGEMELFAKIPVGPYIYDGNDSYNGRNLPLTTGANYKITHAGGVSTVTIDQRAEAGNTVSLGSYTFNGSGSVYLDDVVAETGDVLLSAIAFDAVSFGIDIGNVDTTPPLIEDVKAHFVSDTCFLVQAKITDPESGGAPATGVRQAVLFIKRANGTVSEHVMNAEGDIYSAKVCGIRRGENISWIIRAIDNATPGNESAYEMGRGMVSRGSFGRMLGYHPGMIYRRKGVNYEVENCDPGCAGTTQGVVDPINTVNGNLIEQTKVIEVGSRPDIKLDLTYNSQGGRLGIFGESWTHSYNYHLLDMDNADFTGALVQYPDGRVSVFEGSDYDPEPGVFEELSKNGSEYELLFTDLSKITFDSDGDITRYEDPNGNGLSFSYGIKEKFTLLSQISSIKADGGREIKFEYNGDGLVKQVNAPEGVNVKFEYTDGDLVKFTDPRGNTTNFEYDNHNLTKKISPEGHAYYQNKYDDERRVVEQIAGLGFKTTYTYSEGQTEQLDANNNKTVFKFEDDLLRETIDAKGNKMKYAFDDEKNVSKITDKDGNETKFEYDEKGNVVQEEDALGKKVKREFNTSFNKPTFEEYKQDDHDTNWEYDAKGNLIKIINAKEDDSIFTYDSFGQLVESRDFNDNVTKYDYNPQGDLIKVTDAYDNQEEYSYDELGRKISFKNKRSNSYTYSYDNNNNLTKINGPLGFSVSYTYDKNNHMSSEKDANSGVSYFDYDASENFASQMNQLTFETKHAFGPMNEVLSETDAENRVSSYKYDALYNPIEYKQAAGTTDETLTRYDYTGMGQVSEMIDPEGRKTKYEYDPLQRLKVEIRNATSAGADSENNVETEYVYSPTGKIVKVTDPNGNPTKFEFDELDQLVKQTDAEGQITEYAYDAQGNLIKVTNPRGFITTYEYDKLNRLAKEIDARSGETVYSYDKNSNLASKTDANGVVTKYTYNELDRLSAKIENFKDGQPSTTDKNVATKYEYDPHGNLIATVDPKGFKTEFEYDDAHRNTSVIDAYGNPTTFALDKVDNLKQITDRNDFTQKFSYDNLNRVIQYTNQEDHVDKYSYDKVGNEITHTNTRDFTYTRVYDPLNRLKVETNPLTRTKVNKYDAVGNVLEFTDENGHTDKFNYDKVYRLLVSKDAEGNDTKYNYDKNGNIIEVTDANNNSTNYTYDELDRLIKELNAENEATEFGYDKTVNMTLKTEADGTKHVFEYDPLYRLSKVVDNFKEDQAKTNDTNVESKYSYDANSNLVKTTDPLGNSITFAHDKLNKLVSEINPLDSKWSYTYDKESNLIRRLDANGAITQYVYYPDKELKKIAYQDGKSVDYLYSPTNYPTQMVDSLGTTEWRYDPLDRMTSQVDPFAKALGYDYDHVGNLTKLTYPDKRSVAHTYLKNDWLVNSKSSDKDSVGYTLDKVGNPLKIDRSNSTSAQLNYDKVYRTLSVNDSQVTGGKQLVNKFEYVYNDVGDITQEKAEYGWRQPAKVTTDYKYDGMHRLTESKDNDSNHSKYEYNAAGNRVKMIEELKKGPETRVYSYNEANQLLDIKIDSPMPPNVVEYSFKYDQNGNRIDKFVKDMTGIDRGTSYKYDFENRMVVAQDYQQQGTITNKALTTLQYDGNGRRLVSTYNPGSSSGTPNAAQNKRTEYVFDRLDPVVEYSKWDGQRNNLYRNSRQDLIFFQEFRSEKAPNGTKYFYHHDGEGNITATTKQSGQSDHTYRFDEYGAVMPENGNWLAPHNQYSLSQKQYDANTGLYYFGARHYDPITGTWMSQDSYRGKLEDPKSLHRYMYNNDSPINYIDYYGYYGQASISFYAGIGGQLVWTFNPDGTMQTRLDIIGGFAAGMEANFKILSKEPPKPVEHIYFQSGVGGEFGYAGLSGDIKCYGPEDYVDYNAEYQAYGVTLDKDLNIGTGVGAHAEFGALHKEGAKTWDGKTPGIIHNFLFGDPNMKQQPVIYVEKDPNSQFSNLVPDAYSIDASGNMVPMEIKDPNASQLTKPGEFSTIKL